MAQWQRPGLVWFWFLNDECEPGHLRRQLRAFAEAGASAVVLHARPGLLLPYAGQDWFDLIKMLADECVRLGLVPWLYDEDLCPSGNAGGIVTAQRPELIARAIERYVYEGKGSGVVSPVCSPSNANDSRGETTPDPLLFLFPTGKLLWAGLVPPVGASEPAIELTDRVGMIRRYWEVSDWDSRWYYPATPRYPHPRAINYHPEFGLRVPPPSEIPPGWRLMAFVARPPAADDIFGGLVDPLNPQATRAFIESTHERYAQSLGPMLGREIPAIFTDEPKYLGGTPWTPGLFAAFQEQYGYDLRTRLHHLFEVTDSPHTLATRLHYRQWVGQRFLDAWLQPVSDWCHSHGLALVGHISPEDDPVQQAMCVSNLIPTFAHFDLAGIDLIIPAVGDARHPLINVGVTTAVSAAQQMNKPGVLSETLGASGLALAPARAARILAWQVASGVGTIVVHGAFASSLGLRLYEAPPDFGPDSPRFEGMIDIDRELRPFMDVVRESTQVAPVAILWPQTSFMVESQGWQHEDTGRRKALNDLLLACLEAQVGVQFLDESLLAQAKWDAKSGELRVGKASFTTLLIPPVSVIEGRTLRKLGELKAAGFDVRATGETPRWFDTGRSLEAVTEEPWESLEPSPFGRGQGEGSLTSPETSASSKSPHPNPLPEGEGAREALRAWCRANLPRVLPIAGEGTADLRASRWTQGDQEYALIVNLADAPRRTMAEPDTRVELAAGELVMLRRNAGAWRIEHRFAPDTVRPEKPAPPELPLEKWEVRFAGEAWKPLERPLAVYQLRPIVRGERVLPMALTGSAGLGGPPVAEWMEYRATLGATGAKRATLVLEPTAARGRFTVSLAGRSWDVCVRDTDARAVEIDLTAALAAVGGGSQGGGAAELVLRVHEPVPFDGLKVAPCVFTAAPRSASAAAPAAAPRR